MLIKAKIRKNKDVTCFELSNCVFIQLTHVKTPTVAGVYEQNTCHAQFSWAWKQFYYIGAWCVCLFIVDYMFIIWNWSFAGRAADFLLVQTLSQLVSGGSGVSLEPPPPPPPPSLNIRWKWNYFFFMGYLSLPVGDNAWFAVNLWVWGGGVREEGVPEPSYTVQSTS